MKLKKSMLNGRLENKVDNFIATLEHECDLDIKSVLVVYHDESGEEVKHIFRVTGETNASDNW